MKWSLCVFVSLFLAVANAEQDFVGKSYTPEVVLDDINDGEKGAVQLVWQKNPSSTHYELEIANGHSIYREKVDRHVKHVMLYFNKDYKWRVRALIPSAESEFSEWHSVKVVNDEAQGAQRAMSTANKPSVVTFRSEVGVMEEITVDEGE